MGGVAARFEARLRTSSTNSNGQPSLLSPQDSAEANLQHLLYTRDSSGAARFYIDGVEVSSENIPGTMTNWNNGYRLVLGNEIGENRAWFGTYHLVAIYERALSPEEVWVNFSAGPS
jgi:hypothetical protein